MPRDACSVQFEQTRDDLVAMTRCWVSSSKEVRSARLVLLFGAPVIVCLPAAYLVYRYRLPVSPSILIGVGAGFAFWVLYLGLVYWRMPQRSATQMLARPTGRKYLGPCEATATADHFTFKRPNARSELRWDWIDDVKVFDDRLMLFLGPHMAYVVPARAFDGDGEFQAFVEAVRGYWNARPSVHPTCPSCGYALDGAVQAGCPECGWRRGSPGE